MLLSLVFIIVCILAMIEHNRREIAVQSIYIEFLEKFNAEFSHKNLKVILKSFDQHLPPDEVKKLTDTIHLLSDPSDLDRMKGASIAFAAIALESKSKLSEARWIELLSEDRPILKIDKWTITSEGIAYSNRRSIQEIIEYEVKPPDAERIISYIVCAYDPNVADGVRQMCMLNLIRRVLLTLSVKSPKVMQALQVKKITKSPKKSPKKSRTSQAYTWKKNYNFVKMNK